MIGQASSHGWGRGLPLRGRSVVACGWERGWDALSSTAVWDNATGVRRLLVLMTRETVARSRDTTEHGMTLTKPVVRRRDERDDLHCGGTTRDPRRWPREGLGQDMLLRGPDAARDALGEGAAQPV